MSDPKSPCPTAWRKATASGANGCVEVAPLPDGGVAVRDSKDTRGPVLSFTRHEWVSFVAGLQAGEFSHLMSDSSLDVDAGEPTLGSAR